MSVTEGKIVRVKEMSIKIFVLLALFFGLIFTTTNAKADESHLEWIGSYNLAATNSSDKNYSDWSKHGEEVTLMLRATSITSLQQAGRPKINDLCKYLPDKFHFVVEGRYNLASATKDCAEGRVITTGNNVTKEQYDKDGAIYQTTVFDSTKYKYLDSNIYYFNLRVPYDKQIKYNRGHIWVKFEYLGNDEHKQIMVVNPHLSPTKTDTDKTGTRKKQMDKIVSRIKAYGADNKNIIMAGDLNLDYKTAADRKYVTKLVDLGYTCNTGDATSGYNTYNQFPTRLVDYVCYNTHLKGAAASVKTVVEPKVYTGTVNGVKQMASDHLYVKRLIDFGQLK